MMNKKQQRDGALLAYQSPGAAAPKPARVERLDERITKMGNRLNTELRKFEGTQHRLVDENEHRFRKLERQLGNAWETIDRLVDELVRVERLEKHQEQGGNPGEVEYRLEQLEAAIADD